MRVLIVCRANVGRSQMAEAIFNKIATAGAIATSAGTKVFDREGKSAEGEILADRVGAEAVVEVLKEIGIDAREAVRNQITPEMVTEADLVISMAERDTWPDYLLNSTKVRHWDIADPKSRTVDDTRIIRDQIATLVEDLVREIN